MKKNNIFWKISLAFVFCLGLVFFTNTVSAPTVHAITINPNLPVPTLEIENINSAGQISGQLKIKGQAINFGQVDVYIDGSFKGNMDVENGIDGYGDWEYIHNRQLTVGEHEVRIVLSYFKGNKSVSARQTFEYVAGGLIPAPTLFDPVVNSETTYYRPWVRGVVHNGYNVDVYIDGEFDGTVETIDHESGVTSFKYLPSYDLTTGYHIIQVKAISKLDHKASEYSDSLTFRIGSSGQANFLEIEKSTFEPPVPAPTILAPQAGQVYIKNEDQIEVAGLVHANHTVRIYFDGLFVDSFMPEFEVGDSLVNFDFSLQQEPDLKLGIHTIELKAVNSADQKSNFSDKISIFVITGQESVIVIPETELISEGVSSQVLGEQDDIQTSTEVTAQSVDESPVVEEVVESGISDKTIKVITWVLVVALVVFFGWYLVKNNDDIEE